MPKVARKQPLYDQLVDILTDRIDKELQPGDSLPSERELSDRYGLSRTTVRLALQELERMGLVVRQHGRGTFVANRHETTADLLNSYSFNEQMNSIGRKPSTAILEFSEIEADKHLVENMNCHIGDKIFKLKRMRFADDMPVLLERTFLPVNKFMMLKRATLEHRSLYDIIEHDFHETIRGAEEEFFASIARASDAHLLDINEGDPVLDIVRHTYDTKNNIIEYTLSVARGDQFKYRIFHHRQD